MHRVPFSRLSPHAGAFTVLLGLAVSVCASSATLASTADTLLSFSTTNGFFTVQPQGDQRQQVPGSFSEGLYDAIAWDAETDQVAVVYNHSHVYLLPADDSAPTALFSSQCAYPPNIGLLWSQGGKTLLIKEVCDPSLLDEEGYVALYRSDFGKADASPAAQPISAVPKTVDSDLFLAPDGKRVAYVWNRRIYTVSLQQIDAAPQLMTEEPGDYGAAGSPLAWSPDGTQLAYYEGAYPVQRLYVVNADGSNRRLLTPAPDHEIYRSRLFWSPDSRYLAYYQPSNPPYTNEETIRTVNVDTGETQILTRPGFYNALSWSPDSQSLVFAVGNPFEGQVLFQLELDSQTFTTLTPQPLTQVLTTQWSPEGDWIAFTAEVNNGGVSNQRLYTVRPDGTELAALTAPDEYVYPFAWLPQGMDPVTQQPTDAPSN